MEQAATIPGWESDEKLRELILYICWKEEGDENFGATKLNKILFKADFQAFLFFGKAITGQEYFKLERGPAPRRLVPVMEMMKERDDIFVRTDSHYGYPQHRPIAKREPNLDAFTGREIALVDRIIENDRHKTAKMMSDESHDFVGWKIVEEQETVPYQLARIRLRDLSDSEREYAVGLDAAAKDALRRHAAQKG